MAAPLTHHDADPIYQTPRLRGVSAERFREYRSTQAYEADSYYVNEAEPKVTIKHIGLNNSNSLDYRRQLPNGHFNGGPVGNGRLERQWSHPNLINESVGGRKLPMTPRDQYYKTFYAVTKSAVKYGHILRHHLRCLKYDQTSVIHLM